MEYWTQLYLKEGVARYMEFVGIDYLFPEWSAWTEFVQSVYTLALSLDALSTSHPVEVEVHVRKLGSFAAHVNFLRLHGL